jgi:hypothetical protein
MTKSTVFLAILMAFACLSYAQIPKRAFKKDERQVKKTEKYLKDNHITIRNLDRLPNAIIGLDCDSNIVIKQQLPSMLCHWTVASKRNYTLKNLKKNKTLIDRLKRRSQGLLISGTSPQGDIMVSYLNPRYFVVSGDSLFERILCRTISTDSALSLSNEVKRFKHDSIRLKKALKTFGETSYMYNRLIYVPGLYSASNKSFVDSVTGDTVKMKGYWEVNGKTYYEIRIIKSLKDEKQNYSFRFDEAYHFIDFEGCSDVIGQLTAENNLLDRF